MKQAICPGSVYVYYSATLSEDYRRDAMTGEKF